MILFFLARELPVMPRPRKSLISLSDTPYYHCVSRCVRRAFLCGKDRFSGQSYEHRRQWVEDRLLFLGSAFGIDICAFAVMSNHTHVVLHVNKAVAQQWSTEQVLTRWHRLHKGTILTNRYLNPTDRSTMSGTEIDAVESTAAVYRERLYDISWFMRLLNEYIARRANKEDECTGRFWEGRFKSQALLDETALAACMVYVDLNPIRAGLATSPEQSAHTSIQKRLKAAKQNKQPRKLSSFIGSAQNNRLTGLPFLLKDYIELVEQTGRQFQPRKWGRITSSLPIPESAGLSNKGWIWLVNNIETRFTSRVSLNESTQKLGREQIKNIDNY